MSTGLILTLLVFLDLGVAFVLIFNLASGHGVAWSTLLMAVVVNVLGVMAIRSLRR